MLLDCPTQVEAIAKSNKPDENPAFAGRAAGDECCRVIAVRLRQSEPNLASDHGFSPEGSWAGRQGPRRGMVSRLALVPLFAG